jgi:AcrR family transcriptional regulator
MSQSKDGQPSVLRAARERTRAEITRQILDAARRHLATDGASELSLRAIARELGVSSSAVYRYVASRDDLLTRLIVAAYDSLGAAAETEQAAVTRDDYAGRWSAVCNAVRAWALANPNEYALIYGTPVPGYVATSDTIAPSARVFNVFLAILLEAAAAGRLVPATIEDDGSPASRAALKPVRSFLDPQAPDALLQRGLLAWSSLFGTVSFELFGHLHNVIGEAPGDRDAFFADCVRRWTTQVGIAPTHPQATAQEQRAHQLEPVSE